MAAQEGIQAVKDRECATASPMSATARRKVLPALADLRFRALIGETAWNELPEPVQRRFSKCLAPNESVVYRGNVVETELPFAGRVLAQLTRAIGSPLPLSNGATGPALVCVTEDERLGGQSPVSPLCHGKLHSLCQGRWRGSGHCQ